MRWRSFGQLICLLALALSPVMRSSAQSTPDEPETEYRFGEYITLRGSIDTEATVKSVQLFFQPEGEARTHSGPAQIEPAGDFKYTFTLTEQPVRAFSTLVYWFEATLESNQVITSTKQTFYYEDNRFDWKVRSAAPFQVHWYEGESAFGQGMLDIAQLGFDQVQSILPLKEPENVRIYAYASAEDMRETLQLNGRNWVGAHTDPDLGVVVLSLPPGPEQRLEMERQIPHELMHIMLYEEMGDAYANLPTWLSEGLASIAELYPNPDYLVMLESARQKETLLPMSSLCQSFPRDASGAYLAYAQATSFTRFIYQNYGTSGLQALLQHYRDGLDCERGVQAAIGVTLNQLDLQWRQQTMGEDAWRSAASNLTPWVVVLIAAVGWQVAMLLRGRGKRSGGEASAPK